MNIPLEIGRSANRHTTSRDRLDLVLRLLEDAAHLFHVARHF